MDISTLLVEPDDVGYAYAAKLLQNGQLLAFPTETVYGLGANALNDTAVRSIFAAKGRPLTDPLIVHVANEQSAHDIIDLKPNEVPIFSTLSAKFWPGPLTMIVKANEKIPSAVTASTGFVGVRYPRHPVACRLIRESGLPIAAPSANRFGHVSPTRAQHVLADLAVKGVHVLNGESTVLAADKNNLPCEYGIESTVLKIDGDKQQLIIFRQGAITQAQLESVAATNASFAGWKVVVMVRTVKMHSTDDRSVHSPSSDAGEGEAVGQEAPGQAVTHYAPDVPCYIVRTLLPTLPTANSSASEHTILSVTNEDLLQGCVVLDYHGALSSLSSRCLAYRDLSPSGDAGEAAYQLFDTLRWSEGVQGARKVLIAAIISDSIVDLAVQDSTPQSECDLTLGVADRVFRAASGQFVNLHVE